MNASSQTFEPSDLTLNQIHDLLHEYRRSAANVQLKIECLTDGSHTIMSEKGLTLLREVKAELDRRINALVARQTYLKKRRR